MRKRRADSKLHSLPEGTQRAIHALQEEGMTIEDIRSHLMMPEDEGGFGITVSMGALSEFLRYWRSKVWRENLRQATVTADEVVKDGLGEASEQMDEAIMAGLREWTLDAIVSRNMDPKDAKSIIGLILKGRQQQIDERKVALLEKKAAFADEVANAVASPGGLTAETLEEIERKAKLL